MDIKEFQITYEDIVKFHDGRIKAAERELEKLKNTREFSMDKLGTMVSLQSDIKYHTMVKEACERQVAKKPSEISQPQYDVKIGICSCGQGNNIYKKFCHECGQKIDWEGQK